MNLTNPTRRGFISASGALLVAAAAGPTFLVTGCNGGTVASAIGDAFAELLKLLEANGVLTNNVFVQAAQAAIAGFIAAYDAWDANKAQGTLDALAAAAQAALTAVQNFLNATDIGGTVAQLIAAALEVILSTLESFIPTPAPASFKVRGAKSPALAVIPVKRTRVQFIKDWNTVVVANGHSELQLHLSFVEKHL